jgi:uncharacterized protein
MPLQTASTFRARLLGLALRREPPDSALLLPRTRAVHTFGMRFALDLYWLDGEGQVIRIDRAVPPRRLRACRRARSVIECAAGVSEEPAPTRGTGTARSRR